MSRKYGLERVLNNLSPEEIKAGVERSMRNQYDHGYDGTAPRGTWGAEKMFADCWDSGKQDKEAGVEKNYRCGKNPIGGRKRRHRKTRKYSKKQTKRSTRKH